MSTQNSTNFSLDTVEGLQNAVDWTRALFNLMDDGAVWGIPRSGTQVRVFPSEMRAILTPGFFPEAGVKRVLEAMGWDVELVSDAGTDGAP